MSGVQVTVRLFGQEARAAGRDTVIVPLADAQCTCGHLRAALLAAEPRLAATLPNCRWAVNHAFATETQPIAATDEVALIGLVSGG
jgi:molybdopterin converting factor small subunit